MGHPAKLVEDARYFEALEIRWERPVCPQVSCPQVSVPRFPVPQVSVPRFPAVTRVPKSEGPWAYKHSVVIGHGPPVRTEGSFTACPTGRDTLVGMVSPGAVRWSGLYPGLLSTFPYGKGAFGESCFGLAVTRVPKSEGPSGIQSFSGNRTWAACQNGGEVHRVPYGTRHLGWDGVLADLSRLNIAGHNGGV